MKSLVRLLVIATLSLYAAGVHAAPVDGKLAIETPYSADRDKDRSTMLLGSLSARLATQWTLSGSAQWNIGDRGVSRSIVDAEDKVKGLLAYDLTPDLSLYSYYERRWSLGQDRIVIGASYRFKIGQ